MLMVVCTISFLVHVYSTGYMHGDRRYERYFAFLGFFTFSMLGIVLANNLFFLYVFWELVGLASLPADRLLLPQALRPPTPTRRPS